MSYSEDPYPPPIKQIKCPDCGWEHMNLWESGKVHCGKCLAGGNVHGIYYKDLEKHLQIKE